MENITERLNMVIDYIEAHLMEIGLSDQFQ